MLKKIALGVLLTGLVAVLIGGAVIRTNAKSNEEAGDGGRRGWTAETAVTGGALEEQGLLGQGNGGRWSEDAVVDGASGRGGGRGGASAEAEAVTGQGGGRWAQGSAINEQPNGSGILQADVQPAEWITIEGIVLSATADLVEIETAAGEIVPFEGQPLRYALTQGLTLQEESPVSISGFDEDGEFKIGRVTDLRSGITVTLRDASGRPGWSGRGRSG